MSWTVRNVIFMSGFHNQMGRSGPLKQISNDIEGRFPKMIGSRITWTERIGKRMGEMMAVLYLAFVAGLANADTERAAMTGAQLKACAIALEHFSALPEGPNIINFRIDVDSDDDHYEVIFAPVRTKEDHGRGGLAAAGREVHYFVSKKNFDVIRKSFAR